jgi:hypothetical protein
MRSPVWSGNVMVDEPYKAGTNEGTLSKMSSITAIRIESCFVNVNMLNSIVRRLSARRRSLEARSRDIKRQSLYFGPL